MLEYSPSMNVSSVVCSHHRKSLVIAKKLEAHVTFIHIDPAPTCLSMSLEHEDMWSLCGHSSRLDACILVACGKVCRYERTQQIKD